MTKNCVMGWDAAWTPNGSGAWCVLSKEPKGCKIHRWETSPTGTETMKKSLFDLVEAYDPELIAIDMPVADVPVTSYREADRATTRAFSRFGCPVHSPIPQRPGDWGWMCVSVLKEKGYHCKINTQDGDKTFAEVYPHTALLKLIRSSRRIPYKVGRSGKYWPDKSTLERKQGIVQQLNRIQDRLFEELKLTEPKLLIHARLKGTELKVLEDRLDALICAWASYEILEGRFLPYGDAEAAIWNPDVKELDLLTGDL